MLYLSTFHVIFINTLNTTKNMENFKTWFNANFSLSLNGKWSGLDRVSNLPLFEHKLNKVLTSTSRYGGRRKMNDIIIMRVSGQTCKLYYR